MDIIGLSSTTMTSKAIDFGEKTQKGLLRRSRSFKVIKVGISWKPVCDFLLVINSNWHLILSGFGVIAAYCSNFSDILRYWATFWGLRDNVRCPSWAHWKARSGLPISVNWTFSLGCTAEAPRTKIDWKSAISLQRGHFDPKFQVEGDVHNNNFCMDS